MATNHWYRKGPALLFLIAASYFFFRSSRYQAPKHVSLAEMHLNQLDGTPVPQSAFRNRAIVLNFWAPWCQPCRQEMPWLNDLQKNYPSVTVIGLEEDEQALNQAFMLEHASHFSYTLAAPNVASRSVFGQVAGLPTTLYISRYGKVVHSVTGVVPKPLMEKYLHDSIVAK